ncbi:cytidine deaminase [Acetobacter orleanensis]|uniref:Cytidine deaminase n=1 Tax=Acetobacter orleanensis TaxID=104099 RepID=A0A4Y3TQL8_9PROT|nr:cytidine deaminase [Acetobacter orleanensis]KXV66932.1 cytidine deaminase [Acetobacter orleanensis]PCD78691.1 cytidine deaminase [Acetobacter orleanensis]GAN67338.1 cytidine deaminase [Acetobacter orleanensis JCM 7639]GBR28636.1 cytidine deaminase [Acetobacter orleanensis NRIC 0473]GEB83377.1 cytidine deaminase [Acetobacter orleanensis]
MNKNMITTLTEKALAARRNAYAPYSRFHVGAALVTEDGQVFSGCNVENAAYPEGVCAEAGAISAMVAAGGAQKIAILLVAGKGPAPCLPCGGCRQKIREFATQRTCVLVVDESGHPLFEDTLHALLPASFGPENLETGADKNPL